MSKPSVVRDERTLVVENASYRLAYLALAYGVLAAVAYRGFVLEQSSWDLLALVVVSGVITVAYQGSLGVLSRRVMFVGLASLLVATAVAAIVVASVAR